MASTGAHGANRLASNSLLETVVFAARIAEDISGLMLEAKPATWSDEVSASPVTAESVDDKHLRALMSADVGVIRSGAGLARALGELLAIEKRARSRTLRDMATAGLLIAAGAYARTESRGAHYPRRIFPTPIRPRRGAPSARWTRRA